MTRAAFQFRSSTPRLENLGDYPSRIRYRKPSRVTVIDYTPRRNSTNRDGVLISSAPGADRHLVRGRKL